MQHEPRTELVEIQPLGCKPPLLFFPSLGGETAYVHGIARHLGSGQPVWDLSPTDPMSDCPKSDLPLEEMGRRIADVYAPFYRMVRFGLPAILLPAYLLMKQPVNWLRGSPGKAGRGN